MTELRGMRTVKLTLGWKGAVLSFGLLVVALVAPACRSVEARSEGDPGFLSAFRTSFELDPPVALTDLAQQLRPTNPRIVSLSHTGPSEGGFSNDGTLSFDEVLDRYRSDYREFRGGDDEPRIYMFELEGRVETNVLGDLSSRVVQRQVFDTTKSPPLIDTETRETTPTNDRTLAALAAVTMLAVTAAGCWMARARLL